MTVHALTAISEFPIRASEADAYREASRMAHFCNAAYHKKAAKHGKKMGYESELFTNGEQNILCCARANEIIIAYNGSTPFAPPDFVRNVTHNRKLHPVGGYVHAGFRDRMLVPAHGTQMPLIDAVHNHILKLCEQYPHAKIRFTGHSSGGASALFQAAKLAVEAPYLTKRVVAINSFGQPRLANEAFFNAMERFYPESIHRFVFSDDPAAVFPPSYNGFYIHGGVTHILEHPPLRNSALNPMTLPENLKERHSIPVYTRACAKKAGHSLLEFLRPLYNTIDTSLPALGAFKSDTYTPSLTSDPQSYVTSLYDALSYTLASATRDTQKLFKRPMNELASLIKQWDTKTPHEAISALSHISKDIERYALASPASDKEAMDPIAELAYRIQEKAKDIKPFGVKLAELHLALKTFGQNHPFNESEQSEEINVIKSSLQVLDHHIRAAHTQQAINPRTLRTNLLKLHATLSPHESSKPTLSAIFEMIEDIIQSLPEYQRQRNAGLGL